MPHSAAKFFFFSLTAVSLCRCPRLSVGFQDLGLLVPVAGCWSIYRRGMFLLLVIVSSVSGPVPFILDMSLNFKIKSLTGSGAETFVRIWLSFPCVLCCRRGLLQSAPPTCTHMFFLVTGSHHICALGISPPVKLDWTCVLWLVLRPWGLDMLNKYFMCMDTGMSVYASECPCRVTLCMCSGVWGRFFLKLHDVCLHIDPCCFYYYINFIYLYMCT